jgi:hypothetical protein
MSKQRSEKMCSTEHNKLLTTPISSASTCRQKELEDHFKEGSSTNLLKVTSKQYTDKQISFANLCTRNQETVSSKSSSAIKDNSEYKIPKTSMSEADGAASSPVLKDVNENNCNPCLNQNPSNTYCCTVDVRRMFTT